MLRVRAFAAAVSTLWSRRPVLATLVWWAVLTGWVLMLMILPGNDQYTMWDVAAVAGGLGAALALRRVFPMAAFLVVTVLGTWMTTLFADNTAPWSTALMMSLFALAYLVGRADSGEHPLWLQMSVAVGLVLVLATPLAMPWMEVMPLSFTLILSVVFPWLVGRYRYQHAQLISQGWQRAEQLEREQQAAAEQARLRERTRIAEDMHDSLGHELSLIALRSAALEVDRDLSDRHRDAAGELRRSAAAATERLREIIGLLRADGESASVTPVDESIADLVERARGSGMAITLSLPQHQFELPRMVDRAMHRVVQESVTNAAKHAPGTPVDVEVSQSSTDSTVTVSNPLPADDVPEGIGGGRGLTGLSERVRLTGGVLSFGVGDGVFRVSAKLPNSSEHSLDPTPEPASESAQQHGQVRRAARRQLVLAFVVPSVLVLLLGVGSLVTYTLSQSHSVLASRQYQQIQVGQARGAVDEHLPMFQMPSAPSGLGSPEVPDGAECEYYRSAQEGDFPADVYELCFADDKLVTKYVITAEEQSSANRDG